MKQEPTEHSRLEKTRIMLVDDHPLVREGLAVVIADEPDLCVCGQAETAKKALALAVASRPDLAIVDLLLDEDSGLDLIKQLRNQVPTMKIMVLSMHDEAFYVERALRAGALGYMTKKESSAKLVEGLREVLAGRMYLNPELAMQIAGRLVAGTSSDVVAGVDRLTDRELQVFELLGRGNTTQAIAKQLGLSIKTIQAHCDNIKDKLGLQNATELLRQAVRWTETPGRE